MTEGASRHLSRTDANQGGNLLLALNPPPPETHFGRGKLKEKGRPMRAWRRICSQTWLMSAIFDGGKEAKANGRLEQHL